MNPFAWIARFVIGWQTRLHRTRILPFVHADSILVILLAMIAIVAGGATVESLQSGPEPQRISLARIFSPEPMRNRFVEVEALLFPETRLTYPSSSKGIERPIEFAYVAMIDDDRANVLLVRFKGDLGHGEPRHVTVAGMLQAPDGLLTRLLEPRRWRLAGVPVERRYVLVAGMTPKPTWLFAPACIIAGCIAVGLLLAMLRRPSILYEAKPGA